MNMDYCKFENTYRAVQQCLPDLHEKLDSEDEIDFRAMLIELCKGIAEEFQD